MLHLEVLHEEHLKLSSSYWILLLALQLHWAKPVWDHQIDEDKTLGYLCHIMNLIADTRVELFFKKLNLHCLWNFVNPKNWPKNEFDWISSISNRVCVCTLIYQSTKNWTGLDTQLNHKPTKIAQDFFFILFNFLANK